MKIKELNEKPMTMVKNVSGCTNFGGLEIVGKKMYTIKTRSDNQLSVISEYADYRKTSRVNHRFENCLWHGNDLAYNNGLLYVAPCDKYIEVVNTGDWSHQRLDCDIFLSAIAHVTGNQFVGLSQNYGDSLGLAVLEHRGYRMEVVSEWTVSNPKAKDGYVITQAIGYKKKNNSIFMVMSRNDFHRNVLLRTKIGKSEPDYCFRSKKSTGKYEFEGISFLPSGEKVIGSNLPNGKDKIFIAA